PIEVNSSAPAGACILRTFDHVGVFILNKLDTQNCRSRHWQAVMQGARRAEAHADLRHVLFVEGWLGSMPGHAGGWSPRPNIHVPAGQTISEPEYPLKIPSGARHVASCFCRTKWRRRLNR